MSRADEIGERNATATDMFQGMTIRQAYKIAAMQGLLSGPKLWDWEELANQSGDFADAQLAEDSAHEAAMSGKEEA